MSQDSVTELAQTFWSQAEEALSGIAGDQHALLNTATSAVDAVWDRHVFDHSETFGGPEIGYARAVSAAILARLLGVDYAALASTAASEIPSSGIEALDEGLTQACREALDTFNDELLGPVKLEGFLVYAQPMLLDSPLPIGAVVLAGREPLTAARVRLLKGYLDHFDTRLDLAERLLVLRRENLALQHELRKYTGEAVETAAGKRRRREPVETAESVPAVDLAQTVPTLELFGVRVATEQFEEFCGNLRELTNEYLAILEQAPNLYLDVPTGIDAKSRSRLAAPYLKLLDTMKSLRTAARLLGRTEAGELAPFTVGGRAPSFADLTRTAAARADDETTERILEIMNDQGEEAELDALAARHHPYEFRAANTGEVFALLALHQTAKSSKLEGFPEIEKRILGALPKYQAARAYLLSYDRFEDVPLKGESRTQQATAEKLLLYRENAPSFGVLIRAFDR
jgi:hypothetical protein